MTNKYKVGDILEVKHNGNIVEVTSILMSPIFIFPKSKNMEPMTDLLKNHSEIIQYSYWTKLIRGKCRFSSELISEDDLKPYVPLIKYLKNLREKYKK